MPNEYAVLELYELDNTKAFIKFKGNSLPIGKVLMTFVQFDPETKKRIQGVDIYVNVDDMLLLCNDILNGRLSLLAKNQEDNKPLFQILGGVNEEKCKAKNLRDDGNALSRMMTITKGQKFPFVFTAEVRPGHTNQKGLIVPDFKLPSEGKVVVACNDDMLKKMAIIVSTYIKAYMAKETFDFFNSSKPL